jgi:ELMO/CED-12 family
MPTVCFTWFRDCCLSRTCCFSPFFPALSTEESAAYDFSRTRANELKDDKASTVLLFEIYNAVFSDELNTQGSSQDNPAISIPSPEWKKLGFQNSNPLTDIRTGMLCLRHLHNYVMKYPEKVKSIVSKNTYPFAIAVFNVSWTLTLYYQLRTDGVDPAGSKSHASQVEIKSLAGLLVNDKDVFNVLVMDAITNMNDLWDASDMKLDRFGDILVQVIEMAKLNLIQKCNVN